MANELCDKEKLSDSYLAIGESYQKLRNFSKARKWYLKSWNTSRLIGNLEVCYFLMLLCKECCYKKIGKGTFHNIMR